MAEGRATWPEFFRSIEHRLPLSDVPELREVAPWYFEWLSHPPDDPWWSWADLTTKYDRVTAAVLNISGWHDDPYVITSYSIHYTKLYDAKLLPPERSLHRVDQLVAARHPRRGARSAGELREVHLSVVSYNFV